MEVGTRYWVIPMINRTMFWFGGIWTLLLLVTKVAECFTHWLIVHSNRNMEDSGAECDLMNCEAHLKRFQRRRSRDHSCDILLKNLIDFCPCLKGLPEA